MYRLYKLICITLSLFVFVSYALANVKLPKIISSNMVLQRNAELKIWGWADKGEKVTVTFNNITRSVKTFSDGKWIVTFPPMKEGGPYNMVIEGKNKIELTDIMLGDVWICSGQSNMEWPVSQTVNAEQEIAGANYPDIRLFRAPHNIQFEPVEDVEGGEWNKCTPETVENFSAVGYFFGRDIYKKINVPVGLLFTAWGGTVAETWISSESVSTMEDFANPLKELKTYDEERELARMRARIDSILNIFSTDETGLTEGKAIWAEPETDISQWLEMKLPTLWEYAGFDGVDGIVWFRKEIELPEDVALKGITLCLGPIDDSDITWVNGIKVGEMIQKYNVARIYEVPADILKPGKNVITVRVEDTGGGGGLYGKPEQLKVVADDFEISLAGIWKYRFNPGEIKIDLTSSVGPNRFPALLFNGMIHPFLNFAVKGAIWYQGESNAGRAYQYRTLFPLLINDWRKQWNNPGMSFLYVQLANFMQSAGEPQESEWAELREAQLMTLKVPNTGMAVTIDIGEADNIHPGNKQDVGERLALAAMKIAYGYDIVYSGPLYRSMTVSGNKVIIDFDHTGNRLKALDHYGYVKGFAVAGDDHKFFWARAYIENKKVVTYSENVDKPVAVRYGWADNPDDVNLYNEEGLPASPFRTDNWPGITVGKK